MKTPSTELEHPGVRDFMGAHQRELEDSLGVWAPTDVWVFALSRLRDHIHGEFSGYKDKFGRFMDATITGFMRGEKVDENELRKAIVDLVASFNASCDAVYYCRQRLQKPVPPPYRIPHYKGPMSR